MTKTTPVFLLRYSDSVAMKDGSAFASTSAHTASDINNLVDSGGNKHFLYATYEPDSWLLDGRHKFIPASSTKIGFVSDTISDVNGDFSSPILLTITLDTTYTFEQLTRFSFSEISGDYCTELKVEYRNASDVLIDDQIYFPTTYEYRAELPAKPIANVKYIRVYFYSTNRPYRHLRLLDIGFDDILFRGSEIKSATIVEEISRYSTELKSNTLEVSLFSPTGEFSVVSTTGVFAGLEENQPADMYEEIDGVTNYMGRFYLDKWLSPTPNKMNMTLKDGISIMSKTVYLGGFFANMSPVVTIESEDLIDEIMIAAGLDYELDTDLIGITLSGKLYIGDCRNALQQACFAIGAYATCTRSNKVIINKAALSTDIVTPDYTLTAAEKGMSQAVELKPLTTSLDLKYSEYALDEALFNATLGDYDRNVKLAFDGSLTTGEHIIDFAPDIMYGFYYIPGKARTATVTLDSTSLNRRSYLKLDCTVAGTWNFRILGFYRDKRWSKIFTLGSGTDNNRVVVSNSSLVTIDNVAAIGQDLFDYWQERYVQKIRLYATTIKPGDSVICDTYDGKQIQGYVEKVSTNLAGGFISDVEIVGVLL